ncbi:MAG: hypothetical protein RR485_04700 [Mucinivorans sp.]
MNKELLLCSGAPLDMCDDKKLGEIVRDWQGTKIICGGTTAKIIARELDRSLTVDLESARNSTLPPRSVINGIQIVSEGIITLGRVRNLLESVASQGHSFFTSSGQVDSQIAQYLLDSNDLLFVIGTRLNKAHFDPWIPVRLERRVDLLADIVKILREDFGKHIQEHFM